MTTHPSGAPDDARVVRFRTVYEQTYGDLLRFVQRRVHPSQAEDVVAEAFLVAWRRLDDLPLEPGPARAWLFGIARNTLLNERRAEGRRQALGVRIADAAYPSPQLSGADPDLVGLRVDLAQAWRTLSPDAQECLALAAWDGLSAPEAATVLSISPVAFRLRLSRARRALRRRLALAPAQSTPAPALTERTSS
jgi:RNA polymerase sigma-70 factor (ECF subfamily)